jgi:hypothetical protein
MQIKFNTKWYVDPIMSRDSMSHQPIGYGLYQTSSRVSIAYFPDYEEAQWVAHKLMAGRELCIAVTNALSVDDWMGRAPNDIADDLVRALTEFKRGND